MFAGFGLVLPVLLDSSRVITTDFSEEGEGKKEKKERKQAALHSISRQQKERKKDIFRSSSTIGQVVVAGDLGNSRVASCQFG